MQCALRLKRRRRQQRREFQVSGFRSHLIDMPRLELGTWYLDLELGTSYRALRALYPFGAARPMLLLPDRRPLFEFIDEVTGRLECLCPVSGRDCHADG